MIRRRPLLVATITFIATTLFNVTVAQKRDVAFPQLPDSPFNYAKVTLPTYIDRESLELADNTPTTNVLTDEGATLGRVLFYDKQLSKTNTTSCASCHVQRDGFSDRRRFSKGFEGRSTTRNSMNLANLRYSNVKRDEPGFFWDERAATLEQQVLMPIQDEIEMGMKLNDLEDKLQQLPYYPPLFKAAFGSAIVTSDRIAKSLAQFLRSMTSFNSKFDRVKRDDEKFTDREELGASLFIDGPDGIAEFACAMCHVPPTFNMPAAANIGLELKYKDHGLEKLGRPSNDPLTPSNNGKFKAPSLRNVELTAPFMHDGRFKTLEQVVKHYSEGVHPHVDLSLVFEEPIAKNTKAGFNFSDEEQAALVAFLKTLTDKEYIKDPRFSDPFVKLKKKQ